MNLRTLLGSLVLVMLGLSRPCLAQFPQIFTGRGDVSSEVRGFRDGNPAADFFTYPEPFAGGVRVAVGDVNGEGIPDILSAAGCSWRPGTSTATGSPTSSPVRIRAARRWCRCSRTRTTHCFGPFLRMG